MPAIIRRRGGGLTEDKELPLIPTSTTVFSSSSSSSPAPSSPIISLTPHSSSTSSLVNPQKALSPQLRSPGSFSIPTCSQAQAEHHHDNGHSSNHNSHHAGSSTNTTPHDEQQQQQQPHQQHSTLAEVEANLVHTFEHLKNETVPEAWRSTKATAEEGIRAMENQMSETWDASKAAFEGAKRLLRFEELPREWQSNPYILTGYRFLSTKRDCLRSIFRLHNETCNIWTHMLGLVGLACLGAYIHSVHLKEGTFWDHAVFVCFFIAASKCLLCSTLYHTFLCHSRLPVMRCAAMFDYIGIGVLITASVMATLHYGFYCDGERVLFLSFSFFMGLVGCIFPLYPFFDLPSFRYFRIAIFLGMACSGIIPLTYVSYLKGLLNTWHYMAPFCKSGLAYISGLLFYGHRFPEKQFPGLFDRWGHSHQVWHVAVVAGIYYHYMAMVHFYNSRYTFGCQATYGGFDKADVHF